MDLGVEIEIAFRSDTLVLYPLLHGFRMDPIWLVFSVPQAGVPAFGMKVNQVFPTVLVIILHLNSAIRVSPFRHLRR